MSRARDLSKLGNPNVIKADENSVGFGTQVAGNHANADSSLISAGIITATAFYGDGSNLEGVASAGLGTAVDDTKDSIGQNIYFTNAELSINENTTVNAPDTSSIAYTQYQQVTVESGSELIIADGDSFIPDVLGIGTALQASTAGAGNGLFGTVYADNIENAAGRGGPNFPLGITVAGVSTLSGNVSIGGTLTYEDVTNVDSIGVVTARNGIKVTTGGIDVTAGGAKITGVTTVTGTDDTDNFVVDVNNTHFAVHTDGTDGEVSLRAKDASGNNYSKYMTFFTHPSGSAATERLRIGSAGQIGLSGANYGTSGQVLTSQGSGSAVQWATPSGGHSEYDMWCATAGSVLTGWDYGIIGWNNNNASYGNTVSISRVNTGGGTQHPLFTKIGTGVSLDVNTGSWSFPSTGLWEIVFQNVWYANGSGWAGSFFGVTTDNGSTWSSGYGGSGSGWGTGLSYGTQYGYAGANSSIMHSSVNITDIANQKIRYTWKTSMSCNMTGSTTALAAHWTFRKVA